MTDCCLIKKVATVEVYENKNEVRAYGFMVGDRNTPIMEVRFKHLWGEDNLSGCKLRWIIVDDVGSLLVGEVPIQEDNTATIKLPNELFTGERRMKVQLTVASCDGGRILNLQQFTDLKVINNLATNEVVEPVYNILINTLYDESQKYLKELEISYTEKYGGLENLYLTAKSSLEEYLVNAENGGNAEFLQGYVPFNFSRVENTIAELQASTKYNLGDVVEVLGYYTAGDGANHKRKIADADDGSGVQLANGLWANIVHSGEVNVSWFGAKNDIELPQDVFFNKAINFTASRIIFEGTYYVENLTLRIAKDFIGNNATLRPTNNSECVFKVRKEVANRTIGGFTIYGLKPNGSKVNVGCDFHFFHYGSEFMDFNISDCVTGLKLNECWSSIYRNFRIRRCDVGIHFNNWLEPNLSELDGNVNDNLFIRGVIQNNVTGILFNRQKGFGLQNSFKQIHFEANDTAIHNYYYNQELGMDCISFEGNGKCFKSEGIGSIDASSGNVILSNVMCLVGKTDSTPFLMEGSIKNFSISGIISTVVKYDDYTLLKNIIKINNGFSCILNLTYEFNEHHIQRNFLLNDINCTYIRGATVITSSDSKTRALNKDLFQDIVIRGNVGWNKKPEAYLTFFGLSENFESDKINSFRMTLGKDPVYAFGRPTIQVKKGLEWEDALVLTENGASLYGKPIQVLGTIYSLNTPYHATKMQQEGILDEYYQYLDDKNAYDQQQRELETQRQLAFENRENQEQTYEEWLATQPMLLPVEIESQPSQKVLDFAKRYLG